MRIEEIEFTTNEISIILEKIGTVIIRTTTYPCNLPFNTEIEVFGRKFNYNSFSDYYLFKTVGGKADYKPYLHAVIEENSNPFCALVAYDEVIFIDYSEKSVDKILKMNRAETDDEGFYWLKLVGRENGFLMVYESGAAPINSQGIVLWHNPMRWDDILIKSDDSYLFYSSEYRQEGEEWKLDMEKGVVVEGW